MNRVTIRWAYPDQPPLEVTSDPGWGLGPTPELPAVGEPPLPFWSETIREVVVR